MSKPSPDGDHHKEAITTAKLVLTVNEEYAYLIPALSDSDTEALKLSIQESGQYVPIDVNQDGVILDGHHRYRACQELGIKPAIIVRVFENRILEKKFIIEVNRNRRHLIAFQRIELQCKLELIESELGRDRMSDAGKKGAEKRWKERGDDEPKGSVTNEDRVIQNNTTPSSFPKPEGRIKGKGKGRVIDIAAQKAQVSPMTYYKGREIIKKAPPEETLDKLRQGELRIDKVFKQLENQQKIQDLLSSGANSNVQFPDHIKLIEGDFVEKCKAIPVDSIDLIFTDPPYQSDFLPMYDELAKAASILLKDGGCLVTYCAQDLKYQVIQFMKSRGLTHWWEIAIIHTGSSARMFSKKVIVTWKPLLWFVKGTKPKTFEFIKDSVESQPPDKTLHPWAQSTLEAEHVISKLTIQNDVVLDCLMGTGTTAIAAIKLKRRFVGIEKDTKVLRIAKAQIGTLFSHIKH